MTDMVTVELENGEEAVVSRAFAESKGLTIIQHEAELTPAERAERARILTSPEAQEKVRVKLANGAEATVSASYALVKGLKVLDKPATNRFGVALKDKPYVDLKGKELDQALSDAGLSTSGSAQDKRDRLADHLAGPQPSGAAAPATVPSTDVVSGGTEVLAGDGGAVNTEVSS